MVNERPTVRSENGSELYPSPHVKKDMRENYSHLKGKTLEVYYFLVEHLGQRYGVREIQRTLEYSSPSVAAYHLNRLQENDLISSTESGEYYIEKDPIKLGKLEDHINVAGKMIPKLLLYGYQAVISVIMTIFLFIISADLRVWLVFFLSSNLIFLGILVHDAIHISNKLKVDAE